MTSQFGPTPEPAVRTLLGFLRHNPARHRVIAAIALLVVAGASIRGACDPLRVQALVLSAVITSLLVLSDLRRASGMRRTPAPAPTRRRSHPPAAPGASPPLTERSPPELGPHLTCDICGLTLQPHPSDPSGAGPPPGWRPGWRQGFGRFDVPAANDDTASGQPEPQTAREIHPAAAAPVLPPLEASVPELQAMLHDPGTGETLKNTLYAGSWTKHLFDRLLAACLLVLLSPLLLAITCCLAAVCGRPVIVRNNRPDWSGKSFTAGSFRAGAARLDGGRRSRPGGRRHGDPGQADSWTSRAAAALDRYLLRSGLATLPLLLSVFRGDMSFVGPRPASAEGRGRDRAGGAIVAELALQIGVRPGLTGWSQINQSRGLVASTSQRLALDLFYLENSSLLFDLRILSSACHAMLRAGGGS